MSSNDVQNEELEKYELMLILMADLSQDDTEKELKKIKKLITDATGEIYHEDIWDVRDLAYTIKKQDKGYYVIFYFTLSETKHVPEMERELRINNMVIRHLLVKSPKNYEIKKLADFEVVKEERKVQEPARPNRDFKPTRAKVEAKVEKVEPKVEKPVEKESKKTMDISDLDSQLESLLDDPDINIKL